MLGGEQETRCAAAGVADQVKALETSVPSRAQHAGDLVVKRVARRRLGPRINLEVLRDRLDIRAQRLEQRTVS